MVQPDDFQRHYQETQAALEQRERDLTFLTRVGQELTATLDVQQVLDRLLQAVTETLGAEGSSVWLWEIDETGPLVCQAASHTGYQQKLVNLKVSPGQGVIGWVAQCKKSAIVPAPHQDSRFTPNIDSQIGFKTERILAVPLLVGDKGIGALEVVNKLAGNFNEHDLILVETLAASAAIAIENARLVEALREKTRELEQRNADLDAFAHTVAHDLKNPLGLILGTAMVLETDYQDLPEEMLVQHLGLIARNSRKANSLIEELLLLSELPSAEVYVEPLYMPSILHETQRRLSHLIQSYQAEMIVPEQWPEAVGYAPWVEEVWVNYISNALKYGGRPPRIELGAGEASNGYIRFWVKDNGIGLSPEEQARLFRPFTRFMHVRATGYGLGLSIVRRIIEKLGGKVGVESAGIPGLGSVFSFTLPKHKKTERR
jgi:signal transduction histidine kinase